ncbi:hypothetical protein [Sphingobium sp. Sx8-8]|uniref:hypothetical protein n=1 Tax=Sphingobium sp. Sx8-8 TaxID=2933617 RepID=UPI001F59E2BB
MPPRQAHLADHGFARRRNQAGKALIKPPEQPMSHSILTCICAEQGRQRWQILIRCRHAPPARENKTPVSMLLERLHIAGLSPPLRRLNRNMHESKEASTPYGLNFHFAQHAHGMKFPIIPSDPHIYQI